MLKVHTGIFIIMLESQLIVTVKHLGCVIELLVLFLRMLVYEYVDNGNLDQWLHGDVGEVSPLTWDIRMNIILGTAKGYSSYANFDSFSVT